ncbi:MAG: GIDE domain-containing protein [Candidatus Omnitrophota bacterium]|nr:GIDE domain-containing protein [Candidatus Omnitrophota bacterium]
MERNVIMVLVLFGLGGWYFFWGFMRLRRKRMIENISTSTIRGLALGLVELVGKASRKPLFKSPLCGVDCVAYRYTIERYERHGKSSHWVTIASGDSFHCPFWLDDGTGKIMVFPQGAEFVLPIDYEFSTGWGRGLSGNLIYFMENRGIRYKGFLGVDTLRFREWYIKDSQEVYVLGTAKKTHDSAADYKDKLMGRLQELKQSPTKMAEVDTNKDEQISAQEWDAAVAKVEEELLAQELKAPNIEELADVVIGKGDTQKLFLISDQSQEELTKKLSWQAFGGIFGGAVLAILMFWFLLSYFLWH